MKRNTLLMAGAAVLTALAAGVGGAALANANNPTTTSTPSASATSSTGTAEKSGRHRGGVGQGQGLSGDTAVKAVQAAAAKEPTAVLLRAVKAADGTYRVGMRRTDGTRITLTLDANFTVTATQEHAAKPKRTATPTSSATS